MLKENTKKVFWGFEILFCVYMIYTILFHQQGLMNHKRQEIKTIQQNIECEKKVTDELHKQKEQVNTDEYIEQIAREKLGMIKDDEIIFYNVD